MIYTIFEKELMKKELSRLSKVMSERGICSRREADRFIEAGQVSVNGEIISVLGTRVPENAEIKLLAKAQKTQSLKITVILNKPIGYVSTQPEKGYPEALELITPQNQVKREGRGPELHKKKLAVAGRLDIDSNGLLVLTQDGAMAKKLIGDDSNMEKEYLVRVEGDVNEGTIKRLSHGLSLDGSPLKPVIVEIVKTGPKSGLLRFILTEGKKRQIRRMCEIVKLNVTSLKRVRIGKVALGDLPVGKWRFLRKGEAF
jgi:23S rRNA pseudouridine2604 synthase